MSAELLEGFAVRGSTGLSRTYRAPGRRRSGHAHRRARITRSCRRRSAYASTGPSRGRLMSSGWQPQRLDMVALSSTAQLIPGDYGLARRVWRRCRPIGPWFQSNQLGAAGLVTRNPLSMGDGGKRSVRKIALNRFCGSERLKRTDHGQGREKPRGAAVPRCFGTT